MRDGGLWAVLEPRSNTLRRNVFESELIESLSAADEVVLAGGVQERRDSCSGAPGARANGGEVETPAMCLRFCGADADAIVAEMTPRLREGDVVAILSNGGFGGIYEKLPRAIEGSKRK